MITIDYANQLNNVEDRLIQSFREHPVLSEIGSLTNTGFNELLVQRAFLSLRAFTPVYDLTSAGLNDEEAKDVVRWLIREEYPPHAPSHREDLVTDCVAMGMGKQRILGVKPTRATAQTIEELYDLVSYEEPHYDVKAVAALRLAGEVLVAEEYGILIPAMETRYGLSRENSVFYHPHFLHDQKKTARRQEGVSHADPLSRILLRLVDSNETLAIALRSFEQAYRVKATFYDQFKKE